MEFNHGYNCNETVNFATERWIGIGKQAILVSKLVLPHTHIVILTLVVLFLFEEMTVSESNQNNKLFIKMSMYINMRIS